MTQEEKRRLAAALICCAGDIIELWNEYIATGRFPDLLGIDRSEAAEQMAAWLSKLPGDEWDRRLPQPKK